MSQRIVLLHATPVAMQPVHQSFKSLWPEAERINLLDDGLSIDRSREPELTRSMIERFVRFGRYGYDMNANGILVTCSAFGPAVAELAAQLPIPVLKPNEAMFRAALWKGNRVGMLATFAPAVKPMTDEFNEFVSSIGKDITLKTRVVENAIEELRQGNVERHNQLVADSAYKLDDCDVIMLAQFSTSVAAEAVSAKTTVPVLSAPDSAVALMREMVKNKTGAVSC